MLSELVNISRIKRNTGQVPGLPKNPRLIRDEKFEQLKQSIQEDPEMLELREVIAYDYNGELVVIAGNMRLKACEDLGYKEVPTKILPTETTIQKLRAYTIKDNLPYGEHDWPKIQADWPEAAEWGLDMPEFDVAMDDPFDDIGIDKKNQYGVIVMCESEGTQESVFRDLTGMGFTCKIVVT